MRCAIGRCESECSRRVRRPVLTFCCTGRTTSTCGSCRTIARPAIASAGPCQGHTRHTVITCRIMPDLSACACSEGGSRRGSRASSITAVPGTVAGASWLQWRRPAQAACDAWRYPAELFRRFGHVLDDAVGEGVRAAREGAAGEVGPSRSTAPEAASLAARTTRSRFGERVRLL